MKDIISNLRWFMFLFLVSCGMFEDNFKTAAPGEVTTVFRYAGLAELTLISSAKGSTTSNKIALHNVSLKSISQYDFIINVYSSSTMSFDNLIRSERVRGFKIIGLEGVDTIKLSATDDYIKYKSYVKMNLLNLSGLTSNPLSGQFSGTYKTYKGGSLNAGGLLNSATIDFNGNVEIQLQGTHEFNMINGVVMSDSTNFALLKKDGTVIRELLSVFKPGPNQSLLVKYILMDDKLDSTILKLQRLN